MSCPSREQLVGFLEERLEEALRDSIEKHAENCSACQQCLAQLSEGTARSVTASGTQKVEFRRSASFVLAGAQGADDNPRLVLPLPSTPHGQHFGTGH